MTPKPATVSYLTQNDRVLVNQIAGNNRACRASKACAKAGAK